MLQSAGEAKVKPIAAFSTAASRLALPSRPAPVGGAAPGSDPRPARAAVASGRSASPRPGPAPSWGEPLPDAVPLPPWVRAGSRTPAATATSAATAALIPHPAMAEDLSAATSYTEDDFYCPVCQEVLKTPVRTAACQHV